MRHDKDSLSPLAGWTYMLPTCVALMVAYGVYGAFTGTNSIMGFGNVGSICVDEPNGGNVDPGERFLRADLDATV